MATPLRFTFWIESLQAFGKNTHMGAPSFPRSFRKGWDGINSNAKSISFWLKSLQALALAVAVCFSLGASDASSRFNDLGHRMMCICGCSQLLGECNHVGCPDSSRLRDELSGAIAGGSDDKTILASFSAKYGATVLAAPTAHGFDLVAWIAPFAVFAAAMLGTVLLVKHWSVGKSQMATPAASPEMDKLREQIRRETGSDGGF
jgi:cytochrome c-type biogenesis protein CcmH